VVVPILICKVWLEVVVIARARGRSSPCSLKKRLLRPRDSIPLISSGSWQAWSEISGVSD
jgi:hypothetical protein